MLNIYIYDGTYHGLLTCCFDAWKDKDIYSIRSKEENKSVNLLENVVYVETDNENAERIIKWVGKEAGYEVQRKLYRVFLTEHPDRGMYILRYLKLLDKLGRNVENHLYDDDVRNINKLSRMHASETHRLYGFVRFEVAGNNILYARIEPDFNQLEVIAPYFADRYNGHLWIIHDLARNMAAIFNGSEYIITEYHGNMLDNESRTEISFQKMWIEYLNALTIKERLNLDLQKQKVPLKTRKHLTEFKLKSKN